MTVAAVILAASPESALADADGVPRVRRIVDSAWSGGADVERIAEAWRPYRMWAVVLLRSAWTRAQGGNVSYRRRC